MKKQILFTLVACLLSVSLTAADVSVTEKFSTVSQSKTSGIAGSKWTGDVCTWQTQHARRGSNDVINDKQATWLTLDATTRGYIRTTNLEGGIKSISFPYAQFGAEASVVLKWQVSAGSIVHTIERDGDSGKNQTSPDSYEHVFECKENVQLEILNMSVKDDETQPDKNARLLIGNITITPYLLYTQKEVTIGTKQRGYVNAELIDNTDGDAITYSSSDPTIATVDSQTGVVTPFAAGDVIIYAALAEGAKTQYTLHVKDGIVVENFSKVKQTSVASTDTWDGDISLWEHYNTRRGQNDTIKAQVVKRQQATWFGQEGYVESSSDFEGGVKNISFTWRQWSAKQEATTTKVVVTYGEIEKFNEVTELASNANQFFNEDIDGITNGKLKIQNLSYNTDDALVNNRIVIENIQITPYLLYTTKEAILDTRYATTYTNTDLINNTTGDPVEYTISENTIGATIDAATGAVTATQEGEVTITATWGAVTTSYTLQIKTQTETEASFAEAIKRVDVKDVVENPLTKTDGYDGTIAYASTNTAVATIDAENGTLTIVGVGQTTITATLPETTNYKAAAASYDLYVTDKNALVEKFSNVEQTGVVGENITDFGGDLFAWIAQYQVRRGKNDTIHATAGKHQATSIGIQDPTGTPLSSILQSKDVVEGGIKYLSFYWAQWGAANTTIRRIAVYADNELVGYGELPENSKTGTEALLGISHLMKSNKQLTIKNESYIGSVGSLSSASNSSRIVIDNIHITPYLLYTRKAHTMRIGEIYTNTDLINNIESGSVTYKLEDNDEEASIDAVTGEVTALAEGKVTVKATWSEGAYTTYTLTIIPANCETFDAIAETPNYANTEVLMGDMCEWTTSLGGFNVGDFAAYTTNLVRFRAPYQGSDEQAYIQSGVLSNGIKKLRFNWNVGGNETTTNWDIRILINGREVKRLGTTDLAANVMPEFGTITVENINEPGNFTIRFENHSTIEGEYTSANKARFLIDNIVWENYEETKSLDENVDNSGWLKSNEGAISDVQLVRSNLVANVYNTLCLPFAISKSTHLAGADVQEMTSAVLDGNVLTIGFTSLVGDELEAGVPYLVKPTTAVALNTFSGVQIVAAPQAVTQGIVTLQGIFSPTEMIAGDQTTLFVGTPDANGDNLYYPSATANIKGFRAYFKLNLPDGMNAAPARARFVVNQTEVATGVEQVAIQAQTTKMLRDGQLIILRDGVEYNAQGARVK